MFLLNSIFIIICVVLQLMSLAYVWLYIIEMRMQSTAGTFDMYKDNGKFLFRASIIMGIVLWFTVSGIQKLMSVFFTLSLIAWLLSAVGFLVLSVGKKIDGETKRSARMAVQSSVINVIVFCVITWLFMVE